MIYAVPAPWRKRPFNQTLFVPPAQHTSIPLVSNTLMHLHLSTTNALAQTVLLPKTPPTTSTLDHLHDTKNECHGPDEPVDCAKRRARARNVTHGAKANPAAQEDSQGNEAAEPVHHCQALEGKESQFCAFGRELVREFERDDDQRGEREDGPRWRKDEKVYFSVLTTMMKLVKVLVESLVYRSVGVELTVCH
jgi:hypothetical protein